jgi:hypothetical protein
LQLAKHNGSRAEFCNAIIEYWADQLSQEMPKPTRDEWQKMIDDEMTFYTELFVNETDCLSKNHALKENIWATYVCVMNNIPLWLFGAPGTSKSLAVNLVLTKLITRKLSSPKITAAPLAVSQTYMCSIQSRSEAIINQIGRIVRKGRALRQAHTIQVQILEEISHADRSQFLPLKCLHTIIDNGYPLSPLVHVPVTLVGLSNYLMDSAKLNRGLMIVRTTMASAELEGTASDIFLATLRALCSREQWDQKRFAHELKLFAGTLKGISAEFTRIHDDAKYMNFVGLRDFYGLIQCCAYILYTHRNEVPALCAAIQRNFSGVFDDNQRTKIVKMIFDHFLPLKSEPPISVFDAIKDNKKEKARRLLTPVVRNVLIATKFSAAYCRLKVAKIIDEDSIVLF